MGQKHIVNGQIDGCPQKQNGKKAARGTDGRLFPWGNSFDGEKLNYCDSNCTHSWKDETVNDGYSRTAPIGNYPTGASPYGALDMAGNVWEWVADWYGEDYYNNSPARNPQGASNGESKVLRGGSWYYSVFFARSAVRFYYDPSSIYNDLGFRCLQEYILQ